MLNNEVVSVPRSKLQEIIDGFKEVANRLEVLAKGR